MTILACVSASEQAVSPMVIFVEKYLKTLLSKGEVPATFYGMSQNGWMDQELFTEWFLHHFLEHAVSCRPLMLLVDGHSSHFTIEVLKLAAHDVIFCLPPHKTADSQPLDTACFKPLKTSWSDVCRKKLICQSRPSNHKVSLSAFHLIKQLIVNHLTLPASSHSKPVGQMFVEKIYLPIQAK